eukprot:5394164-Ditylum_brightwellii.AAC.1
MVIATVAGIARTRAIPASLASTRTKGTMKALHAPIRWGQPSKQGAQVQVTTTYVQMHHMYTPTIGDLPSITVREPGSGLLQSTGSCKLACHEVPQRSKISPLLPRHPYLAANNG